MNRERWLTAFIIKWEGGAPMWWFCCEPRFVRKSPVKGVEICGLAIFNRSPTATTYCFGKFAGSRRQSGVRFILHLQGMPSCLGSEYRTEYWVRDSSQPSISVVKCDAWNKTSDAEEKKIFYEQSNVIQEKLPKSDIPMVIGDWNTNVALTALCSGTWPWIMGTVLTMEVGLPHYWRITED